MPEPGATAILSWLTGRRAGMARLLERMARAESPSLAPSSQRRVFGILSRELEGAGFRVRRVRGSGVGDHVLARPRSRLRGAPWQLVVGHLDTVWPVGTVARMPVREEDGTLYGPGVVDMKGGLVQLVFALKALQALELVPAVTPVAFVNSDEEIGSPDSGRVIRLLARGAERAFVLEAAEGPDGRLKIARKGVGRFRLTVRGRAAHAGASFEQGISAILELSHQVQRLFALNDLAHGVTVNVGTIDGGLRPNVVAPEASAMIGVRAPTEADARRLEREIRGLRPVLEGASIEVKGGFGRPPMEPLPRNRALLERAGRLGEQLGLSLRDAGLVGGASDANTTSQFTATLDGLGPIGEGAHALHEQVVVSGMAERAALLALLLLEPPERRQQTERPHAGAVPRRRSLPRRAGDRTLVVGDPGSDTNQKLVAAWQAEGLDCELVPGLEARGRSRPGDVLLGRIDVRPTLDGIEQGLLELLLLERAGFPVLNSARALLGAHDKLLTAQLLARAGIPQPRTAHLPPDGDVPVLTLPVVVKPRFGSWGIDVFRCESPAELDACLEEIRERRWFRRHGAIIQQLLPSPGFDLRLLVAGGDVVGAIQRVAAPGEWRTNVSLGGSKRPVTPPAEARQLGAAAAAAIGADLAGVDLLPASGGGYAVIELNGAVDFGADYSLPGRDVYRDAAAALGLAAPARARAVTRAPAGSPSRPLEAAAAAPARSTG